MKDFLGAALSGLCAVHCAASVVLVAGGGTGLFSFFLESEWIHTLFAALAVVFAVLSFPSAYRLHGQHTPTNVGTVGIVMLILGLFSPEILETPLTVIGAGMAAIAHLWNRRLVNRLDPAGVA